MSDAQLRATWDEVAALAALSFDHRDPPEPLAAAQAAAFALHYHAPAEVLSGPALMPAGSFDAAPLRWFVSQLTADAVNAFWSSQRHAAAADAREPRYGARYAQRPLPDDWRQAIRCYCAADAAAAAGPGAEHSGRSDGGQAAVQQQAGDALLDVVPGELQLPPPNWALPRDFALRQPPPGAAAAEPGDAAPTQLLDQPGLSVWHALDTRFGLPKVHLKLQLVTPEVYARQPADAVAARLLVAVVNDVLLPRSYAAELAGSCLDLSTGAGGLTLKVAGFPGVAQQLLAAALEAVAGVCRARAAARPLPGALAARRPRSSAHAGCRAPTPKHQG